MIWLIAYVALAFLLSQLSGVFHWLRDTTAYQAGKCSKLHLWMTQKASNKIRFWYYGGNETYNPSLGGDFFHWTDSAIRIVWVIDVLATGAFSVLVTEFSTEWRLVAVALNAPFYYLGEWTFTILYHNLGLLKGHTDYVPLGRLLGHLITPWRNFHHA